MRIIINDHISDEMFEILDENMYDQAETHNGISLGIENDVLSDGKLEPAVVDGTALKQIREQLQNEQFCA